MARLDEIKEQLSTLRVLLALCFAGFIATGTELAGMVDDSISEPFVPLNHLFYSGICFEIVIFIFLFIIGWKIKRRTRDIRDL